VFVIWNFKDFGDRDAETKFAGISRGIINSIRTIWVWMGDEKLVENVVVGTLVLGLFKSYDLRVSRSKTTQLGDSFERW
jgi:hypothetical protein